MTRRNEAVETIADELVARAVPNRQAPLFHLQTSEDPGPAQPPLSLDDEADQLPNVAVLECRDNLDFLREQPSEKFKLIVTSPPYNIGKSYEARSSLDHYLAGQEQVIRECIRVPAPNGLNLLASRQLHA